MCLDFKNHGGWSQLPQEKEKEMKTGKAIIHKADSRGYFDHGWLQTYHTFSFGAYHNNERMHFGALRVLNDDTVEGGMGFGKHPHDNMEIVSIPISGALEHKDSTDRAEVIHSGEVQIMSAGTGLYHSEYNHSKDESVNFLQVWIFPKEKNIEPRYDQKEFNLNSKVNQLVNVVSPNSQNGALWINQDAWFYLADIEAGKEIDYPLQSSDHGVYAFVIEGQADVNGWELQRRDGGGFYETEKLTIKANENSKLLLIEVPLKF